MLVGSRFNALSSSGLEFLDECSFMPFPLRYFFTPFPRSIFVHAVASIDIYSCRFLCPIFIHAVSSFDTDSRRFLSREPPVSVLSDNAEFVSISIAVSFPFLCWNRSSILSSRVSNTVRTAVLATYPAYGIKQDHHGRLCHSVRSAFHHSLPAGADSHASYCASVGIC